ncbi:MAG TPA: MerR family transcriptional regulator [Mycobacteriales bacterium]|nr:MerR family transcriptional regulator [Mycobacteriales bacterium]
MTEHTDEQAREYTVGRVAALAGVTVRTLHHYDRIGLVRPSGRTPAGYRVYAEDDIERLGQVLLYRRLGFGLGQVAELLDEDVDAVGHLRRQRELLCERRERIGAMVAAIDRQLEAHTMGMKLTPEEQFEVFGTDKVGGEWAEEAEQRWGATDAFKESQRRAGQYTKADWVRLKAEADEGLRAFGDALAGRVPADSEAGMALAERHRQYIGRWFYDCGYDMHRGLAQMYLADERFTQTFENVAPGLAQYVHDAITANADAHT